MLAEATVYRVAAMDVLEEQIEDHETVWLMPRNPGRAPKAVVYHTGGGETARVIADGGDAKRGILSLLVEHGYVVCSVTSDTRHWGSPRALTANDLLFDAVQSRYGLDKIGILCQSMGGLSAYSWSCRNPTSVTGIYGVYPVTNLGSMLEGSLGCGIAEVYSAQGVDLDLDRPEYDPICQIAALAGAGVPAMHRHGRLDEVVDYRRNAEDFGKAYRDAGALFRLVTVPGLGHEADPAFFKPAEVLGFFQGLAW